MSVASVTPKGGDLPYSGPQRLLPAAVATRSELYVKPKWLNLAESFQLSCVLLLWFVHISAVRFSSLQHFLSFFCRVPADVGGSLKPGGFPTCQPGSKAPKGEPESPQMATPTPSPDSPARSSCQPNSPAESNTCNKSLVVSAEMVLIYVAHFKQERPQSVRMCWPNSLYHHWEAVSSLGLSFSRVIPKPQWTQRLVIGKNTSTSSSTLCVQPPL